MRYPNLQILGNIVETNHIFGEDFDSNTTVRQLLEKVIVPMEWDCSADELNLYVARKNGQPLGEREPECFELFYGKLSDSIREIMSDDNRIDSDTKVRTFFDPCGTYLLLAPPRIRRQYRKSVAETKRHLIKSGHLAAEEADLDELPLCWWEKLRSHIFPPEVAPEKKNYDCMRSFFCVL